MPILAEPSSISFKQKVIYSTAATSRGCLLVYPPGKKSRQRFAVGDSTGVFRVFSIGKRLDAVLAFETDDAKSGTAILPCVGKKAISAATLFSDQLFYAQGSVLRAYSRKGKNFFSTETNVTEQLTAIWIETPFIFLAGEFMVTTMVESKEIGFFLSPDRVHDMCVYSITKSGNSDAAPQLDDYMCCLACNDRSLRLVQSNKMVEAMSCEASLTALRLDTSARRVFYGTQVGSIGVMKIQNNGMLRRCGGHLPFEDATSAPGSAGVAQRRGGDGATVCVTCLGLADVNGDGVDELLVGYEDGTVRVFSIVAEQSSPTARPSAKLESGAVVLTVIWTGSVGERVMSIAGGVITQSPDQPDILIHTYSGQVIAFTLDADGPVRNAAAAAEIAAFHKAALEAKQQDTEREIAELRALIEQRTSELSEATGAVKTPAPVVAVASTFKATATLTPIENMPLLSLVVYADVPLEGVLVQCAPELTFMSTDMATVSRQLDNCGSRGAASRRLLAVSPSQKGAKRLEVHLWADEGRTDTLRLTVISAIAPRTAQMKWVPLYSLPLFARVSADTPDILPEDAPRIISKLIISGSFAGQDVHEWLGQLLPGMAEAPYQEGVNRFAFVSKFLSSVLVVDAEDDQQGGVGRVVFSSNSLLTLASIKRHVTSMTAQRGVSIVVREHILFNSAVHQLRQLQPMMEAMASSARRLQLVKGLQELQGSETHLDFLPVHLQEILASAEEIQVEVDLQAQQQAYIRRTIAGLYSSLVYFKNHTTPLTVATRKQLEAVSCGIEYNPKTLEMLLFPRGEHHHELGVVEQLPQGSAVPQANTETARMLTEASPTSATAPATTSMRRLEAVSAESSRSATPEPVTKHFMAQTSRGPLLLQAPDDEANFDSLPYLEELLFYAAEAYYGVGSDGEISTCGGSSGGISISGPIGGDVGAEFVSRARLQRERSVVQRLPSTGYAQLRGSSLHTSLRESLAGATERASNTIPDADRASLPSAATVAAATRNSRPSYASAQKKRRSRLSATQLSTSGDEEQQVPTVLSGLMKSAVSSPDVALPLLRWGLCRALGWPHHLLTEQDSRPSEITDVLLARRSCCFDDSCPAPVAVGGPAAAPSLCVPLAGKELREAILLEWLEDLLGFILFQGFTVLQARCVVLDAMQLLNELDGASPEAAEEEEGAVQMRISATLEKLACAQTCETTVPVVKTRVVRSAVEREVPDPDQVAEITKRLQKVTSKKQEAALEEQLRQVPLIKVSTMEDVVVEDVAEATVLPLFSLTEMAAIAEYLTQSLVSHWRLISFVLSDATEHQQPQRLTNLVAEVEDILPDLIPPLQTFLEEGYFTAMSARRALYDTVVSSREEMYAATFLDPLLSMKVAESEARCALEEARAAEEQLNRENLLSLGECRKVERAYTVMVEDLIQAHENVGEDAARFSNQSTIAAVTVEESPLTSAATTAASHGKTAPRGKGSMRSGGVSARGLSKGKSFTLPHIDQVGMPAAARIQLPNDAKFLFDDIERRVDRIGTALDERAAATMSRQGSRSGRKKK